MAQPKITSQLTDQCFKHIHLKLCHPLKLTVLVERSFEVIQIEVNGRSRQKSRFRKFIHWLINHVVVAHQCVFKLLILQQALRHEKISIEGKISSAILFEVTAKCTDCTVAVF